MRTSTMKYANGNRLVWVIVALGLSAAGCHDPSEAGLDQGYAALEQSRYDEAVAAADRYLREKPQGRGAAEAMYLRGRAIEQRVKRDDAEVAANLRQAKAQYLQALELSPSKGLEAYIHTSLGNVCYWLGDFGGAASYWKEAYQRLDRGDLKGWVLYRIGLCQQRLGKWMDADGTFAMVQREFAGSEAAERAQSRRGYRGFYVQVAAFASSGSADKLAKELRGKGFLAVVQERPERKLYVVLCGPVQTYGEALGVKGRLSSQFKDALIVP